MTWQRIITIVLLLSATTSFAAERVRIAVMGLFHSNQFILEASPASPLLAESGQQRLIIGADARQIAIRRSGRKTVLEGAGARIVSEQFTFSARNGAEAEFTLIVPGKIRRHYRGNLTITPEKAELVAVIDMDLETAVASIVAAESSPDAPFEAMKAQAVVTRSFLVSGGHRHHFADFCDTTHCQFLREPPSAASPAARATGATSGLVLEWKGHSFAAMYAASCSGRTRSLAQVGAVVVDYPYFSVECDHCRRHPEKWSSRINKNDTGALAVNSERERIQAARKLGWSTLPSNSFTQSDAKDSIVLNGVGRGHGVGLCQRGAASMAHSGFDFRAILAHYFPNTTVEAAH